MLGESSVIGYAMIATLSVGIAIFSVVAAVLRGVESLLVARQALQEGVSTSDVTSARAGASAQLVEVRRGTLGVRARGMALTTLGAAIGYAQGAVSSGSFGDPLGGFLQVALLVLPPFLIGRGLAMTLRHSRVTNWLQRRVRLPLAQRITRALGGVITPAASRRSIAPSGRTEVMLEQAAESIFARLPAAVQESLRAVPAAAAALAREADGLRERDGQLAARERAVRAGSGDDRISALQAIGAARDAARGRLATVIAALETIRMDLLRLDADAATTGLTVQLDVVRDLQRRVNAEAEVHDALRRVEAELTPV